jgi:hypothetical protein
MHTRLGRYHGVRASLNITVLERAEIKPARAGRGVAYLQFGD